MSQLSIQTSFKSSADANILGSPSSRRKSGRDMQSLLSTICELRPTESSPEVQALQPEEYPEGQETSTRRPMLMKQIMVQGATFWRASMSVNTEYFLSGGVRGRRKCLEASLAVAAATAGTKEPVPPEATHRSASGKTTSTPVVPGKLSHAESEAK
jgi:hypothetical protein